MDVDRRSPYKDELHMRRLLFVLEILYFSQSFSLGLADFVPSFLTTKQNVNQAKSIAINNNESSNVQLAVNTNASSNVAYCDNLKNRGFHSSVFCAQNESQNRLNVAPLNSNNATSANVISNDTSVPQTTVNQSTLQDQELKNAMSRYNSTYMLSIQPQNDVKMNVGVNQLQLNIKY